MINLTKLWTGAEQPADGLRYGHGMNAAGSARKRPPHRGVEYHADLQLAVRPLLLGLRRGEVSR